MNAIILYSLSKNKRSLEIANALEGDKFIIENLKKPFKSIIIQMIVYGFKTVANKKVKIKPVDINYDKYDEIYLVSPVWAGRVNAYMRQFLNDYPIINKKIHIIGSCDGGADNYFESFKGILDESNEIVEKTIYIKGVKQ